MVASQLICRLGIAIILSVVAATLSVRAASFRGLGGLPTVPYSVYATRVSADGSMVIGTSPVGGVAARWTELTGWQALSGFPSQQCSASDASADGSIIVGNSATDGLYRWSEATGPVSLGTRRSGSDIAYDVSADGSVIVGVLEQPGTQAFRWTQATGLRTIDSLPGDHELSATVATGVSADGTVIVGVGRGPSGSEAFRMEESVGVVGLGGRSAGFGYSAATAISADGSTIVGGASKPTERPEAFRWTPGTGMVGLGVLAGDDYASASAVAATGEVIVGWSGTWSGEHHSFIWTPDRGMRSLEEVLTDDFGLDLGGWRLSQAFGISNDGRTIVGEGVNASGKAEGWLVRLSDSSTGVPEKMPLTVTWAVIIGIFAVRAAARRSVEMREAHPEELHPTRIRAEPDFFAAGIEIERLLFPTSGSVNL